MNNALKIQFWHQLLENSLNLSINLSCRFEKYFFGSFFTENAAFLLIPVKTPGNILEFHNLLVERRPIKIMDDISEKCFSEVLTGHQSRGQY